MSASEPSPAEKVHRILEKFRTAMLVTHAGGDRLRSRPMAIAQVEEDCRLWFLSLRDTAKVHEIETDTHVHIVCANDSDLYLSMEGLATLTEDRAKVEELWNPHYQA